VWEPAGLSGVDELCLGVELIKEEGDVGGVFAPVDAEERGTRLFAVGQVEVESGDTLIAEGQHRVVREVGLGSGATEECATFFEAKGFQGEVVCFEFEMDVFKLHADLLGLHRDEE